MTLISSINFLSKEDAMFSMPSKKKRETPLDIYDLKSLSKPLAETSRDLTIYSNRSPPPLNNLPNQQILEYGNRFLFYTVLWKSTKDVSVAWFFLCKQRL